MKTTCLSYLFPQPMPIMHLLPDPEYEKEEGRYECPLYKTAERAGTLSTTGQFPLPLIQYVPHFIVVSNSNLFYPRSLNKLCHQMSNSIIRESRTLDRKGYRPTLPNVLLISNQPALKSLLNLCF